MAGVAKKTDPKLWERVKTEVTEGDKGGRPGQWSARKAQLASAEYKRAGGGYQGGKSADNHLSQWTREAWGTKSGGKSGETGERYLPQEAREALSDEDYARSTAKKRADTRKGRQFSRQPADVAGKTAPYRESGHTSGQTGAQAGAQTRDALMAEARRRGIPGRSRMNKADLERALGEPVQDG